jgi:hypothetical protein
MKPRAPNQAPDPPSWRMARHPPALWVGGTRQARAAGRANPGGGGAEPNRAVASRPAARPAHPPLPAAAFLARTAPHRTAGQPGAHTHPTLTRPNPTRGRALVLVPAT